MKQTVAILGLVGAVALAVAAGQKMSGEAAAVLIGVVCGVAAGIPTAVLLLVALTRRDRQHAEETYQAGQDWATGPVILIDRSQDLAPGYRLQPPAPPATRQWYVVGGDDLDPVRSDRP
jgi:hypothetical protein